jgi:F-type H+-transporting ATPase subunit epsilon
MTTLRLEVISAERVVYEDDVNVVVAPGQDGELGILPHHAPLITVLQAGELLIRKGSSETSLMVSGGFLEVMANKATVLADAAEDVEEIDEQRAQEAMRRAQDHMQNRPEDIDLKRALTALRRAQMRLNLVQRRRVSRRARPTESP